MSKRPAEHEVVALAEKIIVQLAGKPLVAVRSVHLLSLQVDHVGDDVVAKKAFSLAEAFLKERSRRATAHTAAILDELGKLNERVRVDLARAKKTARKKGKR